MTTTDKVIATIPRGEDLELHVKATEVDGEQFANIREYVPSRDFYGRGVLIPLEYLDAVQAALDKLAR